MHIALYRKYRSRTFDDVVGQEHVTDTLKNAIKTKRFRHAYLFTGPHGVGKTSVARILAHEIAQLPYESDTNHLDIIEIDAASNRRIDEVRDLRDKARIAPTSAEYKVYIIDEVHMLTNEAFNALLKTLEEPPAHVVFILATTESHKLPQTIVSRTQRFQFKPIQDQDLKKQLASIAKKEDLKIEAEAIELLVNHAHGSFRDAISLIDQVSTKEGVISATDVRELLGEIPEDRLLSLIEHIRKKDAKNALETLGALADDGYAPASVARQMISIIINSTELRGEAALLAMSERLLTVQSSSLQQYALEIIILSTALDESAPKAQLPGARKTHMQAPEKSTSNRTPAQQEKHTTTTATHAPSKQEPVAVKEAPEEKAPKTEAKVHKSRPTSTDASWPQLLTAIKEANSGLYSILRMAHAENSEGELKITFKFPFHEKRATQTDQKQRLDTAVASVYGAEQQYSIHVDPNVTLPEIVESETIVENPSEGANAVVDIMGGGQVIAYEDPA